MKAVKTMKASRNAIALIKRFEGVRLKAYKPIPSEDKYTIGYGHYGVLASLTIDEEKAEKYLKKDVAKAEKSVNKYATRYHYDFNQNQFDALVSFTYNVGSIKRLTANGTRSVTEIGESILLYVKGSGKVLKGLIIRRRAEHALYTTPLVD
jgi:GH24 family phage-related lysozyme (muramidase)